MLEFASPTRRGSDTKRGKSAPRRQTYENQQKSPYVNGQKDGNHENAVEKLYQRT